MRRRQRGGALLITVVLIITVAAFAAMVTAQRAGQDVQGSNAQADAIEALFLAESGIEQALKRFATGTACNALAQNITDLTGLGLGTTGRTITISAGLGTDFSGATLPATQCRIPVTATITATGVSRTIHAIVDRNLLGGPNNFLFNNPSAVGPPTGWTLNPVGAYANNGGPDGTAACSRSAWLVKEAGGNRLASGVTNVQFTVAAASTTTVDFYRRVINRASGAGCAAGVAGPAIPCAASGNDASICFQVNAAGPVSTTHSVDAIAGGGAACPTAFTPPNCQTGYAGFPAKQTVTITMGATTAVTSVSYFMRLQNGGQRELFLDNIEVTNNTAIGAARVQVWRDCSTATNPATCL